MHLDDEVCLCFHVTKRKLLSFLRIEKPKRPGQLSECFGAGTGCGWCRAYLTRMHNEAVGRGEVQPDLTPEEYAARRQQYIHEGKGTPPGGSAE
jgi:bacterioferritin-associated ferredoxin